MSVKLANDQVVVYGFAPSSGPDDAQTPRYHPTLWDKEIFQL